MSVTIVASEPEFHSIAAWRIITEMQSNPQAVIGLSTGQTTKEIHATVSRIYQMYPFDASGITFFGVDEVINVPRDYYGSCYTMLKTQLIDNLGIAENNFVMPPTISDDMDRECQKFQETLMSRGGIDLQILGLGMNGHIGFNQPGSSFENETWLSEMDEALESRIRKELELPDEHKLFGLTLGIKNIMKARKIILAVKGKSKAAIVKQAIEGPVTNEVPASILQLHPNCEFLLDSDAASLLTTVKEKIRV
jgi:glucosamine-6-phosphate deaminase